MVNDRLWFSRNKLCNCRTSNNNFVGPLVGKALVQLHFDDKYVSSVGVDMFVILSSFTNALFEKLFCDHDDSIYTNHDVISHGLKTKSLMLVTFKTNVRKYNLKINHTYLLTDMNKDFIRLYNPHGKITSVPKKKFFECLEILGISYYENRVFNMTETINLKEFTESWRELEGDERIFYISFDLFVLENDTELLINFLENCQFNKLLAMKCYIVGEINHYNRITWISSNASLRATLQPGSHRVVLHIVASDNVVNFQNTEDFKKCLNKEENNIFVRFASSKHYTINKTDGNMIIQIKEVLQYAIDAYKW